MPEKKIENIYSIHNIGGKKTHEVHKRKLIRKVQKCHEKAYKLKLKVIKQNLTKCKDISNLGETTYQAQFSPN